MKRGHYPKENARNRVRPKSELHVPNRIIQLFVGDFVPNATLNISLYQFVYKISAVCLQMSAVCCHGAGLRGPAGMVFDKKLCNVAPRSLGLLWPFGHMILRRLRLRHGGLHPGLLRPPGQPLLALVPGARHSSASWSSAS